MEPITIGSKGTASVKVDETNLALTVGSGSLPVFATPMLLLSLATTRKACSRRFWAMKAAVSSLKSARA